MRVGWIIKGSKPLWICSNCHFLFDGCPSRPSLRLGLLLSFRCFLVTAASHHRERLQSAAASAHCMASKRARAGGVAGGRRLDRHARQ